MRVLVTGATGYIGGRLTSLLVEAGYDVRLLVRDPRRVTGRWWAGRVEAVRGDLADPTTLAAALDGVDVAYYLVHAMSAGGDFAARDRDAATNFVRAAAATPSLRHVIYLGGLLPDGPGVSVHLRSRGEVGAILRAGLPTTEFRAGPIIGSGSASFELVRYLTERLPIMLAPRWVRNEVQPIAVRDVLSYLMAAAVCEPVGVVEIGGADRLSFRAMLERYAALRGLKRRVLAVPFLAPRLASLWIDRLTPIPRTIAAPLIDGIVNHVIADTSRATEFFPDICPMGYERAVERALRRIAAHEVETRWSGALNDAPEYQLSDREGIIQEVHSASVAATPDELFATLCGLGGEHGWLTWNWAWRARGMLDGLVGGPGLSRGRRDPDTLIAGEALDFWRVETLEAPRLLRLRAEMKVPGKAWLQFNVADEGSGSRLVQTALFVPRGLAGVAYWYALYPVHRMIFQDMIAAIAARAERRTTDGAPAPAMINSVKRPAPLP